MAVITSDDFSTAGTGDIFDRTPVASTIGAQWKRFSGQTFNGDGSGRVAPGNDGCAASIDTGASDLDISVDLIWVSAVSRFSVGAMTNSVFNPTDKSGYLVWNTDASNIRLSWFNSSGTRTDYATVSAGLTFVADTVYTLRFVVSGTLIKFYINGVERISQTDANVSTRPHATIGGISGGAGYNNVRYDNFVVDNGVAGDTEKPVLTGTPTVGTKTSSTIQIAGPAGSDNVGITAYEFSTDGGATWPLSSPTLPYNITSLAALTSYNVGMRAKDAAGNISDPAIYVTTSTYRAGALGSTILLTTGPVDGNPAGILYNDVATDGSDDNKWFSFRITEQTLNGGTLDIDPDGTFTFTGAASGNFTYQLEVDGVDVGSPQLVTLYDQTTYRPTGDVTTTGWTSTGANFYDQINESPSNDSSFVTSPPLSTTTDPLTLDIASMSAGNYIAKFRARKTQTTGAVRMVFLGAGGASVGETAWQPVTTSFALYELPVTLTATSARVRLDVRE